MTRETLESMKMEVNEKLKLFHEFGFVSEEFWKTHDELVQLLYRGLDIANELGDTKTSDRFREVLDELKEHTPSGYWK